MSRSPKNASFSSAICAISRSSRRARGSRSTDSKALDFVCPYAPAITFSLTLMLRKSRSVWNVRAMPRCVILCGARPAMFSPSKRISPESGS